MDSKRQSIYGISLEKLRSFLLKNGANNYTADQIYSWIYCKREFNPRNWTNISKEIQSFILGKFSMNLPKIVKEYKSQDGTYKFLIGFSDGNTVESVLIPARDRLTLCVSSQVGCAIGCKFCHTGKMGLKRNLTSSEIVGQFMAVSERVEKNITNIVFMGQGEPLNNFNQVKDSILIFLEDRGLSIGQRRITISTSGLVPQIEQLDKFPPVNIAISLHASHDNVRSQLMPINKIYDLKRLFNAIELIPLKAHRRITYEYILIDGVNDGVNDIKGLVKLLRPKKSKINIIPFNEYPQSEFSRPSDDKISWFQKELINRGYVCTVRTTMGEDILAACGQLNSLDINS